MLRASILLLALLLTPSVVPAQTPTDSQTLQSLLSEVRQLRHDLHSTTVSLQRSQILLHRLEIQENAVNRATQRRDEAESKVTEIEDNRKELASYIKQSEEQPDTADKNNEDANARQSLLLAVPQMKAKLQSLEDDAQQAQAKLVEGEEQLRLEQAKLADLEAQLDRLDKSLEEAASQ